jgi:hypothetical protein
VLRHLPKTLRPSRPLRGNRDGTLSRSYARRESPHPNTENGGDDKRDPAYAHWNGQGSNSDLGVLEQSQQMTNRKNSENDARDAQSSFLRVHGVILVGAF